MKMRSYTYALNRMRFMLCFFVTLVLCLWQAWAQTPLHSCGSDYILHSIRKNPTLSATQQFNDQLIHDATLRLDKPSNRLMGGNTYHIPVVVHVVHNNGNENISDAQIQLALRQMNDAFANRGYYDSTTGVAVNIEFCLAQQDPNGKYTTGITRTQSALTEFVMESQDISLKNLNRWDPLHYINIWVVREVSSLSVGSGVAAYAYFPSSHGNPEDGIVIESRWVGSSPANTAILVHEMGHYLGLYHTFQNGCPNNDCLMQGDHVCDTPPDASTAPVQCASSANSCTTDEDDISNNNPFRSSTIGGLGDQNDMISNYMDYGLPQCYSAFTAGQRDRMLLFLTSVRKSLFDSKGCTPACTTLILAVFLPPSGTIYVGSPVTFTNSSVGAVSWEWIINGNLVSTSKDLQYTFPTQGTYTITLRAKGTDSNCVSEKSINISVLCIVDASFTSSSTSVPQGGSITFTSTSSNATTYKWYIDGNLVSTSSSYSHTFNTLGGYRIYLVASNSICSDTSEVLFVRVGNCSTGKEADNWYFGYGAGISFADGKPASIGGGQISTSEGVASISDKNGKLLLYTDGVNLWNGQHQRMAVSGSLGGSTISAQSSIIIQQPEQPNIYYIFCVPNWTDPVLVASYTIVDISRNGGLGAVIQQPTKFHANVSERIAAVYHANCKDIWIVTHEMNNNRYVAYLLTATGIQTTPVFSNVGTTSSGGNRYGALRFSPDGKFLCSTLGGSTTMATTELLNFNSATGVVSNAISLSGNNDVVSIYSSEFSSDMTKLYTVEFNGNIVYQYDLASGIPSTIFASRTQVSLGSYTKSVLQMGPDGVIYVGKRGRTNLDAITLPNAKGSACGYVAAAVDLGTRTCDIGLPNFMSGYFLKKVSLSGQEQGCIGVPQTVSLTSRGCAFSVPWWTIRGKIIVQDSTPDHITFIPIDSGTIQIIGSQLAECGVYIDSLNILISPPPYINIGADKKICFGNPITLDAGGGFSSYLWSNGKTSRNIIVSVEGTYWVEVQTASGCISRDTIVVTKPVRALPPQLGNDISACAFSVVVLDAGAEYTSYRWQDGSTEQRYTAFGAGTYHVRVSDSCGNIFSDTIVIREIKAPSPALGNDTALCISSSITLDAGAGYTSYRWQDGSTQQRYTVTTAGTYHVSVVDSCGNVFADTLIAREIKAAIPPALGDDLFFCTPTTVTLDAGAGYSSYRWQDGSAERTYTTSSAGSYFVTVSDSCGNTFTDTITISVGPVSGKLRAFTNITTFNPQNPARLPIYITMGDNAHYPLTIPKAIIRVQFDRRILLVDDTFGSAWTYSKSGDTGTITITLQNLTLQDNTPLVVGEVHGYFLLSVSNRVSVYVSTEADSCIATEDSKEDVALDICFYQGRHIRLTEKEELSVFPNPVDDNLRCSFSIPAVQGDVSISLVSTDGKEYELFRHPLAEGKHTMEFNIQDIPSGSYICKLMAGTSVVVATLSVIH